jgi:hypothetical protein
LIAAAWRRPTKPIPTIASRDLLPATALLARDTDNRSASGCSATVAITAAIDKKSAVLHHIFSKISYKTHNIIYFGESRFLYDILKIQPIVDLGYYGTPLFSATVIEAIDA